MPFLLRFCFCSFALNRLSSQLPEKGKFFCDSKAMKVIFYQHNWRQWACGLIRVQIINCVKTTIYKTESTIGAAHYTWPPLLFPLLLVESFSTQGNCGKISSVDDSSVTWGHHRGVGLWNMFFLRPFWRFLRDGRCGLGFFSKLHCIFQGQNF